MSLMNPKGKPLWWWILFFYHPCKADAPTSFTRCSLAGWTIVFLAVATFTITIGSLMLFYSFILVLGVLGLFVLALQSVFGPVAGAISGETSFLAGTWHLIAAALTILALRAVWPKLPTLLRSIGSGIGRGVQCLCRSIAGMLVSLGRRIVAWKQTNCAIVVTVE